MARSGRPGSRGTLSKELTKERKARYLEILREEGEHHFARIDVGVSPDCLRQHRKIDAEFDQACDDALHIYRRKFVAEIVRRGKDGYDEPIYYQGVIVGYATKYSDRLLLEHARKLDSGYREKVEVKQTSTVTTTDLNLDSLQPESRKLLEQIIEIEAKANVPKDPAE